MNFWTSSAKDLMDDKFGGVVFFIQKKEFVNVALEFVTLFQIQHILSRPCEIVLEGLPVGAFLGWTLGCSPERIRWGHPTL